MSDARLAWYGDLSTRQNPPMPNLHAPRMAEQRLAALERAAATLEPDADSRSEMRSAVVDYTERFLEELGDVRCFIGDHDQGAQVQAVPVQEEGRPIGELLDLLRSGVDSGGLNPASAGHLAYIPGGGIFPSSLGDMIAAVTNHYAGMFYPSPGAVRIENQMVRWMADLVGFPATAKGDLTSGGSIANLTGIFTAREAKGIRAADIERSVIYRTAQVHHCVGKAIRIAGLGECVQRTVPMDSYSRMDAVALAHQVEKDQAQGLRPFLVVASAGTTDTGAVDPLGAIADVAERASMWFHVDAAYGGFFLLAEEVRDQLVELRRADSVVLDPHKGLFLPYGSGALLVRDGDALQDAHAGHGNYLRDMLPDQDWFSPANHSAELTRPFRGLRMWLPLHLFGIAPFRAAISEKIWLARYFHEEVAKVPGIEVGPYPDLSVVTFRARSERGGDDNELNARLIRHIHQDGRIFVSSTTIDGVLWLRLAALCFRTHRKHVDLLIDIVRDGLQNPIESAPA